MRKVSKILERAWIAAVLPLLALGSCIAEKEIYPPSGDDATVAFSLMLPASAPSRAMTDGQENEVKTMDILVFSPGGDYVYTARCSGADITTDGGNVRKKTFTVKLRQGDYDLVLLANARALTNASFSGKNKQQTLNMLIAEMPADAKWPSDGSRPIPMWGDVGTLTITEGASLTDENAVTMTRMLARVDVGVTAAKFLLKSVHVYNYNTEGRVVPSATAWDAAGKVAKTPTLVAGTRVKGPVNYTAADGACVQEIYLFEAENLTGGTAKQPSDRTCLVVGGVYDANANTSFEDDGDPTYYRVDFSTGSGVTEAFKDVLRNHHYMVDITSVTQSGYATADDAFVGGSQLTATVTEWNLATQSVIGDGQWWLTVSRDDLELDYAGGTATLTAETNYNRSDLGFLSGLYVTVEYDDPDNTGWLTVTNTNGTGDGDLKRTLEISATVNNNPPRTAKINIAAANFTKVINVTQVSNSAIVRIYEYINGQKGAEITSLDFVASGSSQVDARSILVEWRPKTASLDITTSTGSHQSAFVYNAGSDQITAESYSDAAGTRVYTIQPGTLATSSDPFYEQGFTASFSATNDDGETATAHLDVRHYNRNGVVAKDNIYLLDGSTDHSFTVKSNVEWTAYYVRQEVTSGTSKQFITTMGGRTVAMDNTASKIVVGSGGHNLAQGGTRIEFSVIDEIGREPEPEAYLGSGHIFVVAGTDESGDKFFSDISESLYCASAVPVGESNCYMIDHANPMPILIPVSQIGYALGTSQTPANGFLPSNWITNFNKLKVQVLWSDVNEFGTNAAVVKVVAYNGAKNVNDGKIVVIPGSGTGNAGIILYEDNDDTPGYQYKTNPTASDDLIRWSWHIWKSDYFPYADGTYPSTDPTPSASGINNIWMDRNIGATVNEYVETDPQKVAGFLYQWGRKDPFPSISEWGTTFTNYLYFVSNSGVIFTETLISTNPNLTKSVQNPMTRYLGNSASYDWFTTGTANQNDDLWGGSATTAFLHNTTSKKSVYDPCPEGYRVPQNGDWGIAYLNSSNALTAAGWLNALGTSGTNQYGQHNANYGGYYPAIGYRHNNNNGVQAVSSHGQYWLAGFLINATVHHGSNMIFDRTTLHPNGNAFRANAFPVRCRAELK